MSMDLAVFESPKDGERLSCLRLDGIAALGIRLSAMRKCQVSEPTCMSTRETDGMTRQSECGD